MYMLLFALGLLNHLRRGVQIYQPGIRQAVSPLHPDLTFAARYGFLLVQDLHRHKTLDIQREIE